MTYSFPNLRKSLLVKKLQMALRNSAQQNIKDSYEEHYGYQPWSDHV